MHSTPGIMERLAAVNAEYHSQWDYYRIAWGGSPSYDEEALTAQIFSQLDSQMMGR